MVRVVRIGHNAWHAIPLPLAGEACVAGITADQRATYSVLHPPARIGGEQALQQIQRLHTNGLIHLALD